MENMTKIIPNERSVYSSRSASKQRKEILCPQDRKEGTKRPTARVISFPEKVVPASAFCEELLKEYMCILSQVGEIVTTPPIHLARHFSTVTLNSIHFHGVQLALHVFKMSSSVRDEFFSYSTQATGRCIENYCQREFLA
jgi:hypothetical protein